MKKWKCFLEDFTEYAGNGFEEERSCLLPAMREEADKYRETNVFAGKRFTGTPAEGLKDPGNYHFEAGERLGIALRVFPDFLWVVVAHTEDPGVILDNFLEMVVEKQHGRLCPVDFVAAVYNPVFHQGL